MRFAVSIVFALAVMAGSAAGATLQPGDIAVHQLADGFVHFTIITANGSVGFAAGQDWPVTSMNSRPPDIGTGFQIPAVNGTTAPTNLFINLIDPNTVEGQTLIASIDKSYGSNATAYKSWKVYEHQSSYQGGGYTVLDATAPVADMVAGVVLAWPNLTTHGAEYDAKMKVLFYAFLDSVFGQTGPYQPDAGEIVRRPDN